MPRSWGQLLGEEGAEPDTAAERAGLFSRLRDSLSKSRQALTAELASAAFDPGDAEAWERLEEAHIRADVGVPATAELVPTDTSAKNARKPRKFMRWYLRFMGRASRPAPA